MAVANFQSEIQWSGPLEEQRHLYVYESLDLLYVDKSNRDDLGHRIGLIASCTTSAAGCSEDNSGLLHKIGITTEPDLNQSRIAIEHQVKPGLGPCARIITVNEKLKVAGFDGGSVIPIKNFGPKKTFNSDVACRLTNHLGQICSLAASPSGDKFASGATDGAVAIYQARNEEIQLISRSICRANTYVTAMTFVKPNKLLDDKFTLEKPRASESMLIYGTSGGRLKLLDTRLHPAELVKVCSFADLKPRSIIYSILCPQSTSGWPLFVGAKGQLATFDLRNNGAVLNEFNYSTSEKPIRAIREIVIERGSTTKRSLAYSNSTSEIVILDMATMRPDRDWFCERPSRGIVRDLVQVEDRIITCGDQMSIGSWCLKRALS